MDLDQYKANIVAENDNLYKVLVIKYSSIAHLCWKDPNYTKQIIDLDVFDTVLINKDNWRRYQMRYWLDQVDPMR